MNMGQGEASGMGNKPFAQNPMMNQRGGSFNGEYRGNSRGGGYNPRGRGDFRGNTRGGNRGRGGFNMYGQGGLDMQMAMNNPQIMQNIMMMQAMNMQNMNLMQGGNKRGGYGGNNMMNNMNQGGPQNMMGFNNNAQFGGNFNANSNFNAMQGADGLQQNFKNMPNFAGGYQNPQQMMPNNNMMATNQPNSMMQPKANTPQVPSQQSGDVEWTPDLIAQNLEAFDKQSGEFKRNTLGRFMYNKIPEVYAKIKEDESLIGKVTAILIDFETFELKEIVDLLRNNELLLENIEDAINLIKENK